MTRWPSLARLAPYSAVRGRLPRSRRVVRAALWLAAVVALGVLGFGLLNPEAPDGSVLEATGTPTLAEPSESGGSGASRDPVESGGSGASADPGESRGPGPGAGPSRAVPGPGEARLEPGVIALHGSDARATRAASRARRALHEEGEELGGGGDDRTQARVAGQRPRTAAARSARRPWLGERCRRPS